MLVYKLYNTLTNLGIALDSAGWQFFRLLLLRFIFFFHICVLFSFLPIYILSTWPFDLPQETGNLEDIENIHLGRC